MMDDAMPPDRRRALRALPTHPGFLFIASVAIAGMMERLAPLQFAAVLDGRALTVTVATLFGAAVALFTWSFRTFRAHATTVEPGAPPSALIVRGPYRWSRNPMYVGLLLVSLAFAILTSSLWFLAATTVLAAVLDRIVIPREETTLGAHFGDEFRTYRRKVRRWL